MNIILIVCGFISLGLPIPKRCKTCPKTATQLDDIDQIRAKRRLEPAIAVMLAFNSKDKSNKLRYS